MVALGGQERPEIIVTRPLRCRATVSSSVNEGQGHGGVSPRTTLAAGTADRTRAWIVLGLLFLFMLINFADRAVLGLAAVPIMQELGPSHTSV
jgi:hypothetical protein